MRLRDWLPSSNLSESFENLQVSARLLAGVHLLQVGL